jgi:hypothetical protein
MSTDTPEATRLLEMLGEALVPSVAEPTRAERDALRIAVSRTFAPLTREPSSPRFVVRRRLPALSAAFALAVAAAIAIVRPPLPDPVRSAAHAIGLPVDSVALADTKHAITELRSDLEHHDTKALGPAVHELRSNLAGLRGQDLNAVEPEAQRLLIRAGRMMSSSSSLRTGMPGSPSRPMGSGTEPVGLQPGSGTSEVPGTTTASTVPNMMPSSNAGSQGPDDSSSGLSSPGYPGSGPAMGSGTTTTSGSRMAPTDSMSSSSMTRQ